MVLKSFELFVTGKCILHYFDFYLIVFLRGRQSVLSNAPFRCRYRSCYAAAA